MRSKDILRLFVLHGRDLQAYLSHKVRDTETARELMQESFLRFVERTGHPGPAAIASHRSYLYGIAHNLAVDHIRRQRSEDVRGISHDELVAIPDDQPSQQQSVEGRDEIARLRAALEELPLRTQQIFTLVRIQGLTGREAAARLGISDSSVEKHLARAIKHVMQHRRNWT